MSRLGFGSAFTAALLATTPAWAFCPDMNCGSRQCVTDQDGCSVDGLALAWVPGSDLTVAVDLESAAESGVDPGDAVQAVELATLAWAEATCAEGAPPSLTLRAVEPGSRAKVRVRFRSESWPLPYPPYAFAGAHTAFDLDTGVINKATIEMNSVAHAFALNPAVGEVDLVGVLTHELGHVIGLDHSRVQDATMVDVSGPFQVAQLATLGQDDVDGLCTLYPPGATAPETGESGGCSTSARGQGLHGPGSSALAGLVLVGSFMLARRRHAARA